MILLTGTRFYSCEVTAHIDAGRMGARYIRASSASWPSTRKYAYDS
jgi:hypothetical protein